jgi:L,D-transpeptidase ErfK/SrfK
MFPKLNQLLVLIVLLFFTMNFCYPQADDEIIASSSKSSKQITTDPTIIKPIIVQKQILVEQYFPFLDSIVLKYDSITSYKLSEHLLVRANPWIIDTLSNTDYYRMKARDSFVYDQKKMIVLPKDAVITIPDSSEALKLLNSFKNTLIDINIPEYKLRIYEDSTELFKFPIRVGKNEKKYLKMAGRDMDLKTITGHGTIVNHFRNPDYVNPVNGHQYFVTNRDDKKVTKLPQIPFIETEINGIRYGQLIHPTTNPETLEKAYSNGCIGVKEADAWVIYYYTPIGTKIKIRYNLNVFDETGNKLTLEDIYGFNK